MEEQDQKQDVLRDAFSAVDERGCMAYLNQDEQAQVYTDAMIGYAEKRGVSVTATEVESFVAELLKAQHEHLDALTRYYVQKKVNPQMKAELEALFSHADSTVLISFLSTDEQYHYVTQRMVEMAEKKGLTLDPADVSAFVHEHLQRFKELDNRYPEMAEHIKALI